MHFSLMLMIFKFCDSFRAIIFLLCLLMRHQQGGNGSKSLSRAMSLVIMACLVGRCCIARLVYRSLSMIAALPKRSTARCITQRLGLLAITTEVDLSEFFIFKNHFPYFNIFVNFLSTVAFMLKQFSKTWMLHNVNSRHGLLFFHCKTKTTIVFSPYFISLLIFLLIYFSWWPYPKACTGSRIAGRAPASAYGCPLGRRSSSPDCFISALVARTNSSEFIKGYYAYGWRLLAF